MNQKDIEGIYAAFQQTFLTEGKKGPGDEDLPGAKGKKKSNFTNLEKKGGPKNVKGVEAPKEENDKKSKKTVKEGINNDMSIRNLFDKLYEEVMDDEDVLGIGGDDSFGDDFEDEVDGEDEGDEVTVTLPRDVAQQLCDALKGLLGETEDEGEGDFGEDDMGDDEGDDDFGSPFGEGVDFQKAPDGVSKMTSKGNMKAGNVPVSSGAGSGDYTDEVGEDGDYGHAIVSPKKGHGGKSDHSNMKVKAKRPGQPGSHAFGN